MNQNTMKTLQFHMIKEAISTYCISELGKEKVDLLSPSTNKKQILSWLEEVTEAKEILRKSSSVPIHGLKGVQQILNNMNKGVPLRTDQLVAVYDLIDCAEKLRRFMKDKEGIAPKISTFVYSLFDLQELASEIVRCIRNGKVDDYASKELLKIRKQIAILEERIKDKIDKVVKSTKYAKYLQDAIVSVRNGRYVIPVKKEYRKNVNGTVLDASASGSTVYIEPEEISLIQDEISGLKFEEEVEEHQILMMLTGLVEKHEQEIKVSVDTMAHYDFVFAKAKYSQSINGRSVQINEHHTIKLRGAKHPLLHDQAVPLSLAMGEEYDALVITGPNTGGKTVAIKTVALLTLMAQSGIHIPVEEESEIAIFHQILVDIGDGQSIEQSLSTFSSHIKNIIEILKETTFQTLVLLDELGSGTDPAEGMGLATAILQELYKKGATILATTHYSEIKDYANNTEGFQNGSMEFDIETLKPTYRLIVGKGGESQAFAISLKLGIHPQIIENAHKITYKEEKKYGYSDDFRKSELDRQLGSDNKHIRSQKHKVKEEQKKDMVEFSIGDNVRIPSLNDIGIVFKPANDKGELIVFVKGEKLVINQKRVNLYIKAEELYPEGYDMSIIFETKEDRKIDKLLSKKHVEGVKIERNE
ncbi:endonuclease MutS2 [Cytobacillus suaedae]|nr:endonuclease MutS2 [Cytobacillus suaedae]